MPQSSIRRLRFRSRRGREAGGATIATLSQYLLILRNLIQSPTAPVPLLSDALLTVYINTARGQVAAIGDVLPGYGTLNVNQARQIYAFSELQFPGGGGAVPLAIETVNYEVGTGSQPVNALEWQRFNRYELGQPFPKRTPPRVWTQFGQGALGSLFINALDGPYTLTIKARLHPADLVDDSSLDAIPYLWSDAVPFLAAWYAYMALQRQADADKSQQRFGQLMQMARGGATPTTQPGQFTGTPDPYMAGRLGVGGGPQGQRGAQPRQQTPPTAA